jgi:hypothetical protein
MGIGGKKTDLWDRWRLAYLLDVVVVHEVPIAVVAVEMILDHVVIAALLGDEGLATPSAVLVLLRILVVTVGATLAAVAVAVGVVGKVTFGTHVLPERGLAAKVGVTGVALELRDDALSRRNAGLERANQKGRPCRNRRTQTWRESRIWAQERCGLLELQSPVAGAAAGGAPEAGGWEGVLFSNQKI